MRTPRSALGSESSPTDQRTSQPRSEAALCITAEFHNLAPREEAPRIHVAPGKVAPISLAIANVLSISASNGDYTLPHISQDWRGKKIQKKNALIRMFTRSRPKLANMRSFTARRVKNLGFIHLLRECASQQDRIAANCKALNSDSSDSITNAAENELSRGIAKRRAFSRGRFWVSAENISRTQKKKI